MSSYLPEKVFAVCTHNAANGYGKLLVNPDIRGVITVSFKSQDRPLLTLADKKLDGQFSCKTGWSSGVGTIAFGVGVGAGLAVAAAVATVPVAGWIVGGAIALLCIGIGLFQMFKPKPTCSEMISYDQSFWLNPHPSVTFDDHPALTKQSMLQCKEGGFLLPFISESAAASAASTIGNMNKTEIGLIGVVSFIGGFGAGFTLGTAGFTTALSGAALGVAGSYLLFQPLEKMEKGALRDAYNDDSNPYYETMVESKQGELGLLNVQGLPTGDENGSTFDSMDDFYNPVSVYENFRDIRAELERQRSSLQGIRGAEQQISRLTANIAEIDRAIAEANKTGSFAKGKNPYAAKVFEKARNGHYGPQAQQAFTNSANNGRGMNRESNYNKVIDSKNQNIQQHNQAIQEHNRDIRQQNKTISVNKALKGANIASLVIPFAATGFSETTLSLAADAAMSDISNGISIVAQQH
ncbi:hypothetical protein ED312_11905 [Sinomicrobium pectinilyticum]|uniref:DUF4280 domain-containing protein n=1 Tax=Sinomicrobium pectinilyticum TaxID=1084421 RepID=A0A3N0EDP9_SINP1|nr:hypothetical protein [Sinomicrobium pectinilyticum]RNL85954.1 hypothetical protein ED312_11905 [Sinomicrobium pectinilyticum]